MEENMAVFSKGVLAGIFVALVISITPILAVEYTVGVKAGDWTKYGEISASWTGTGTEPEDISEMKQTEWMKAEVQSVSGTSVAGKTTTHYKNGTEKIEKFTIDVATASGNLSLGIIPSGLQEGNTIPILFGTGIVDVTLNDTLTRYYAGASRSVNLLNISSSVGGYTSKVNVYWDKTTGVLLELFMYQSTSTETGQRLIKATETNMWSAEAPDILGIISSNLIYIVIIAVIVVIIVVGFFVVRRRKPAPKVIPTPTTGAAKNRITFPMNH